METVIGVVGVAVLLVVAYVIGTTMNRVKNARFTRAWQPLVPVIAGHITGDGSTSWLSGRYRDQEVTAASAPGSLVNGMVDEDMRRYNAFDITATGLSGSQTWTISRQRRFGVGTAYWSVAAGDSALEERLRTAGILEALDQLGGNCLRLEYSAKGGRLVYRENVTPALVPTPERFVAQLDFLLHALRLNEQTNPA